MRVSVLFPKDGQTNLHISNALNSLGHEVQQIDSKKEVDDLVEKVDAFSPELVLCARNTEITEQIKHFYRHRPRRIIACWNVDKRYGADKAFAGLIPMWNNCHFLYTVAETNIRDYEKVLDSHVRVKHLQQGCDPIIHKFERHISDVEKEKYRCDVMFAGHYPSPVHVKRNDIVGYVKHQCEAAGLKFNHYSKENGNPVLDRTHNIASQCAKICLSTNGWAGLTASSSVRIYKHAAAGGFVLEEWSEGMNVYLEPGKHCDYYTTKEVAWEKIQFYIDNEEERRKIAMAGYKHVRSTQRYQDRVQTIVNDAQEYLDLKFEKKAASEESISNSE